MRRFGGKEMSKIDESKGERGFLYNSKENESMTESVRP